MNIQLLQVFLTTAREGSISKAALTLNYAQSNVTNKIQQLENDLQTKLFYRHSRGITLTPQGKFLFLTQRKFYILLKKLEQPWANHPRLLGHCV